MLLDDGARQVFALDAAVQHPAVRLFHVGGEPAPETGDPLRARAQFESSPLFSEREKATLAYAEAVTYSDRHPAAEHFARLRRHFDDDAILELTALIAFQNLSSKFNAALGVEPQGFCSIAPQPVRLQEAAAGHPTHESRASAEPTGCRCSPR